MISTRSSIQDQPAERPSAMHFPSCHGRIWRVDDFSKCIRNNYIKTLIPGAILLLSLLFLTAALIRHFAESRSRDYQHVDSSSIDTDLSDADEAEIFARASHKLPHVTSNEYYERPSTERVTKAVEILAAAGLVALHITCAVLLKHQRASIVKAVFWVYVLALVTIKNLRLLGASWTRTLFTHIVLLMFLTFPLAFFELRSAILRQPKQVRMVAESINFALVSILLLISITYRFREEPYRKVSQKGLPPTQEPLASLFSIAAFNWVNPVIWNGYFKAHTMENVWDLRHDDYAQEVLGNFTTMKKASNLTIQLFKHFKGLLLTQAVWALLFSIFTFAPTLLLKKILEYLEDPQDTPRGVAWLYCAGLLIGSIFSTVGNGQALFIGRRICIRLRAIIIGEVYAKALRRKDVSAQGDGDADDGQANNGQIINLMAIDAFKVSEICAYLHYLIASVPIELTIAIGLLYSILGWSAAAGILAMIFLLPLNYYISKQFSTIQEELMKTTDIRINRMNELLNSIRIIKYFAWEESFKKDINECRAAELKQLRRRFIMFSISSLTWNASPVLITLLTFFTYTKLAHHDLTASVAFTSLSLFNVLRSPLDQLADMITNVLQSKVSLDRVSAFLSEEETKKYDHLKKPKSTEGPKIGFVKGTFTWASQKDLDTQSNTTAFQIKDLSIEFPVGELSIVSGPTGSGKTSLLMALLGEMTPLKGDAFLPGPRNREDATILPGSELTDSVAYCAQQAWLLNDTIRSNILFASEYDAVRYERVIKACALSRDLDILDHGDQTLIGEKGIALSGGQKQRVSLARALYSRARHLLLDDCLSAVDSHTAKWIFRHGLTGELVEHRTRILVTHNVALCLPEAAFVVVLENGKLLDQGRPSDVVERGSLGHDDEALKSAVSVANSRAGSVAPSRIPSQVRITDVVEEQQGDVIVDALEAKKLQDMAKANAQSQEETRAIGSVKWSVYGKYTKALGSFPFWTLMSASFLAQRGLDVLQSYWTREWASSYATRHVTSVLVQARGPETAPQPFFLWQTAREIVSLTLQTTDFSEMKKKVRDNENLNYYLGIYALIAFFFCVATFARIVIVSFGSIRASKNIHEQLLDRIVHAKARFLDKTPMGQILNRFSKDLETIDQELAMIALAFLHDALTITMTVIIITLITPGFLIAGVVITALYTVIGAFYIRSSRELKRLESVTRSPIYQHFGETLAGVVTIRAYGDNLRFIRDNLDNIDTNNRPFYYLWALNRWLSVRVDLGGALVSFFAAVFVILNVDRLDAGLAGISLTYAISFTDHILWCVRLYSMLEMSMNSVERIDEYLEVEQEAPAIVEAHRVPAGWPSKGVIEVENLVLQYAPELPAVIRDVSFKVEAGAKIGIVGRTGAGKSTIATAFFRLIEPTSGRITVDGIDITKIGLRELRQGLTIIPQDPTLFQRTLRYNLDPFGEHTDSEIFEALRRVHLIGESSASSVAQGGDENINVFFNLDTQIAEGGNNLSQGQKQLLCLARALLRMPRVILMDESTASVDHLTDAKIQKTIRHNFKHSSILTIAHRLRSIVDYDKILVLDAGELREFNHPHLLLQGKDSVFREMCEASGEYDVLCDMAKQAFEKGPLVDLA
ncbi:hypothetical protein BCR37DRAFT_381441 [Protomyces lactucae-debilis]|uniref:P-loop containing nucleoside triphosphate hydrolase protein n=1 Tax=Protomyces lactucae-debilis TaxID=2754530 RepID=A0A1Y2F9J5_PROLT|nr:uncharacterized protein BCR37DRAFT_381441 [Protomyces lactucae-debilis]ORY79996.1 hypothetical protein BCR37DRAFT_381441 [Protomyces lactucae-debilis]